MAIDTSIYDADLAEMVADESHTITIDGVSYAVSATDEGTDAAIDDVGYVPGRRVTFTVRTSVLAAASIGQAVTYNGRLYRVEEVDHGQDDKSLRLRCAVEGE